MDKNEQERIFSRMILQGRGHNMDSLNLANKAVAFEGHIVKCFHPRKFSAIWYINSGFYFQWLSVLFSGVINESFAPFYKIFMRSM